jgi:mannan endo-1,4-beta-mannosidase
MRVPTSARAAGLFAVLLAALCLIGCGEGLSLSARGPGSGFYVSGTKLYDGNGVEFRIQGVNANHWWNTGSDNRASVPYIKAAGANAARLVFGPAEEPDHPDYYVCSTAAERRAVVEKYIQYRIVPIVEYHNATGSNDPAKVVEAANFWIGEDWVRTYEKYVIVNITNEWCASNAADDGGRLGSDELWRDAYLAAVSRLRSAGVRNTLVIDSINWASEISALEKYGKTLVDADPLRNILFSLHMYGGWRAPGDPDDDDAFYMRADEGLDRLRGLGLAVLVGEFNHDCAVDWDPGAARNSELLDAYDSREAGWLCWMWFNSSGNRENMVVRTDSLLYTDFGKTIAAHLAGAREATCFPPDPVPPLPNPPVPDPDWSPEGPLTVTVSNEWWMDASLPDMAEIASMRMEASGDLIAMSLTGWGPFALNIDLTRYLNTRVRFLIGAADGSEAWTEYGNLGYDPAEGDDESIFAVAKKP